MPRKTVAAPWPELRTHLAKIRPKAEASKRAKYAQRLRDRLKGLRTPGEIWRVAYLRGYQAAYQSYLNKVRRGEVIVTKARRVRDWNAA